MSLARGCDSQPSDNDCDLAAKDMGSEPKRRLTDDESRELVEAHRRAVEADGGVDRAQIRQQLTMTPEQRLASGTNLSRFLAEARRGASRPERS